jgi:hypothetical protein
VEQAVEQQRLTLFLISQQAAQGVLRIESRRLIRQVAPEGRQEKISEDGFAGGQAGGAGQEAHGGGGDWIVGIQAVIAQGEGAGDMQVVFGG